MSVRGKQTPAKIGLLSILLLPLALIPVAEKVKNPKVLQSTNPDLRLKGSRNTRLFSRP